SLAFIPASSINPPGFTSFGTSCSGLDFDNTYKLGADWFDTDGTHTSGNVLPVIVAPATASGSENVLFSVTATASDADAGQLVTLSQTNDAPFLPASSSAGPAAAPSLTLTGTPNFTQAGTYTVTWNAVDNFAPAGSATPVTTVITIANTDRDPVVAFIANVEMAEGETVTIPVSATDADGDVIMLSASLPPFATLLDPMTGTGSVTTSITVAPDFTQAGAYTSSVTALANGQLFTVNFQIVVNNVDRPPVLSPIADLTVPEGATGSTPVSVTDPDVELITLTASLPAFAVLDAPLSGTGTFSTTVTASPPAGSAAGSPYAASVTATSGLLSDTQNFQIIVTVGNNPPVLAAIGAKVIAEGATTDYPVSATDADGDLITISASLPAFGTLNAPLTGTGTVTTSFTLAPGVGTAGTYTGTVTATAAGLTDSETFTITVTAVGNEAVVLDAIANITLAEGTSASAIVHATDADNDFITVTATLPAFATLLAPTTGTGSVSTTISINPGFDDAGVYTATVTATDGILPVTRSFTITVTDVAGNQSPTISAPATQAVDEGQNLNFSVTATDGDGDPLTLTASGVPAGATFTDNGNGTGTFNWTPTTSQAGTYTVVFSVSDGKGGTDSASTIITVNNLNGCPTANAGGPYTGIVNVPVAFNGSASSDPDGDALTYTWTFGDGGGGLGAMVSHTYTAGGTYTVTLLVTDGTCEDIATTTATISTELAALVFTAGGDKAVNLGSGKPAACVQIEPVGGSFTIADVDLSTIKMVSVGTGSVSEIFAVGSKTSADGDKNHNGVLEINACFTKDDLRLLFADLPVGRNMVTVTIMGNLITGGTFQGTVELEIRATGRTLKVKVSPNPLNPETTLSFQISTPGRVTVKIFDLNGRLVKTLLDDSRGAGYQDLTWNGTNDGGVKVASGVYYFRLDTPDGRFVKAATVLK
ncbi:MAG TPA: PKD domain-containing protein, partial [Candidatus Eisenbacteria bacterium]